MKRFTATEKWHDPWFWGLPTKLKMLWLFLCDNCDAAGVFEWNAAMVSSQSGEKYCDSDLRKLDEKICRLENGKYVISKFIGFQYGKLSDTSPAHKKVFLLCEAYGFIDDSKGIRIPTGYPSPRVSDTLLREEKKKNGKEEDKGGGVGEPQVETVEVKKGRLPTTPEAIRVAELFRRKLATEWSDKEIAAWRKAKPTSEELDLIEPYYAAQRTKGADGIHRRDLCTFLNNFPGEVDRARAFSENGNHAPANHNPFAGLREVK